jgi:hypothetical protein
MIRVSQVFGRDNPIPVGRTKFYEDIVHREGGDQYIPGTKIPRLRLTRISDRVVVAFEDEVSAIADAFRARRDTA